jgi:hypothetical protein
MRDEITRKATAVQRQRYPEALATFAAGSMVRGEATAYSDIDLVVIHRSLPSAYRESFKFEGTPVEALVHDQSTLEYFFLEVDRPTGVPALAQMVAEGIEIPGPSDTTRALKQMAASVLELGPPALTAAEKDDLRYVITDLLDDLRDPRSRSELIATGCQLYPRLADYYLRASGRWSAKGKSLPRLLQRIDPQLCAQHDAAFRALFERADATAAIALAEAWLQPEGGLLFEGYRRAAPPGWRMVRAR